MLISMKDAIKPVMREICRKYLANMKRNMEAEGQDASHKLHRNVSHESIHRQNTGK